MSCCLFLSSKVPSRFDEPSVWVRCNLECFYLVAEDTDGHSSMIKVTRFIVKGHVQGVGFRWATLEQALQRGLCGWVRNCRDGSLEVLAKGTESTLSSFKTWLWQGPSGSRVSEIHVTLEEQEPATDTFYIR